MSRPSLVLYGLASQSLSDSVATKICSMETYFSGSGLSITSYSCNCKRRNLVLDRAGTIQGFPRHEMQEGRAGLEAEGCHITQLEQ